MRKGSNVPNIPPFTRTKRGGGGDKGALYSGMPGYIDAGADGKTQEHFARGTSSIGPHSEGPIGKKGSGSTHRKIYGSKGADSGTMVKDYKKESTNRGGKVYNTMEGPHKRPASSPHKIGGPEHKTAMGHASQGHPGRMEHMSGRARTAMEGRRKSRMY
jgi:hypothetical protein